MEALVGPHPTGLSEPPTGQPDEVPRRQHCRATSHVGQEPSGLDNQGVVL